MEQPLPSFDMSLFSIFVKMAGRPALVVGGGELAVAKIEALLAAGAAVTVVAPEARASVLEQHQRGEIEWLCRGFDAGDAGGKTIVFAATGKREIDRDVFDACYKAGVLCNAIDDPEYCDFYSPAIVRRGDLQIAISTNGQSPALAQQIRRELEVRYDASWSERLSDLGRRRREVLATFPPGPERTAILHAHAREAMSARSKGTVRRVAARVLKWFNTEDDKVAIT